MAGKNVLEEGVGDGRSNRTGKGRRNGNEAKKKHGGKGGPSRVEPVTEEDIEYSLDGDNNSLLPLKETVAGNEGVQKPKRGLVSHVVAKYGRQPNINCRVETFTRVVDGFDDIKRCLVKQMGFGGLLEIQCKMLPRQLCYWLMTRFRPDKPGLKAADGTMLLISEEQVHCVFGTPIYGKSVPIKAEGKKMKEQVKNLSSKYGLDSSNNMDIVVNFLEKEVRDAETTEQFMEAFLIFALGTVLCPSSGNRTASELLPAVTIAHMSAKYDWSVFVLDWLVKSGEAFITSFKENETFSKTGSGCALFLAIFYLDRLNMRPVRWDVLPRVSVWKSDLVSKARMLDRKPNGDFGAQGVVDVAYGEKHPLKPRDTAGVIFSQAPLVMVIDMIKEVVRVQVRAVMGQNSGGSEEHASASCSAVPEDLRKAPRGRTTRGGTTRGGTGNMIVQTTHEQSPQPEHEYEHLSPKGGRIKRRCIRIYEEEEEEALKKQNEEEQETEKEKETDKEKEKEKDKEKENEEEEEHETEKEEREKEKERETEKEKEKEEGAAEEEKEKEKEEGDGHQESSCGKRERSSVKDPVCDEAGKRLKSVEKSVTKYVSAVHATYSSDKSVNDNRQQVLSPDPSLLIDQVLKETRDIIGSEHSSSSAMKTPVVDGALSVNSDLNVRSKARRVQKKGHAYSKAYVDPTTRVLRCTNLLVNFVTAWRVRSKGEEAPILIDCDGQSATVVNCRSVVKPRGAGVDDQYVRTVARLYSKRWNTLRPMKSRVCMLDPLFSSCALKCTLDEIDEVVEEFRTEGGGENDPAGAGGPAAVGNGEGVNASYAKKEFKQKLEWAARDFIGLKWQRIGVVFVPVLRGGHWYCFAYSLRDEKIVLIDSLVSELNETHNFIESLLSPALTALLTRVDPALSIKLTNFVMEKLPMTLQSDINSCGIHMLQAVKECAWRFPSEFDLGDVYAARLKLLAEDVFCKENEIQMQVRTLIGTTVKESPLTVNMHDCVYLVFS